MILAVLQARMASPRMPGKAMAPLCGEPMIWRQVERIRQARRVGRIIVATTDRREDDVLASFLVSRGQTVFRGASENLTQRFLRCIEAAGPVGHVMRLKGDSPFVDPALIDEAVRLALASGADYVSNRAPPSHPRGLEVELARVAALTRAAEELRPEQAEEVSPMSILRRAPERFTHARLRARTDGSRQDWRVKTPADFAFARAVYEALHPVDPRFGMDEVLNLVECRQDLARWAA